VIKRKSLSSVKAEQFVMQQSNHATYNPCAVCFLKFVCSVEYQSKFVKVRRLKGNCNIDLTDFAVVFCFVSIFSSPEEDR